MLYVLVFTCAVLQVLCLLVMCAVLLSARADAVLLCGHITVPVLCPYVSARAVRQVLSETRCVLCYLKDDAMM